MCRNFALMMRLFLTGIVHFVQICYNMAAETRELTTDAVKIKGGCAMLSLSAELLALTSEPALLVKGGKILFANEAAAAVLGPDCRSKSFRELFGKEIAGMQASTFVGEAEIAGRRVLLRIRALEGTRVVFISVGEASAELIGDAFLFALRNELMQLATGVSLLRMQTGAGNTGAALNAITMNLYRANRTLQNLSIIRSAEANTLLFMPQPLDLVTLLRDLIDSVRLTVSEPEIRFNAPETLPVNGDPSLLETLMLNLLANCIQHAEGCTRIHVNLHGAGDQAILSVDDDGCGIPGEKLNTVLERYRFGGGLSETGNGPGLGLTAAREIARTHGGTLLLESSEGVGTAVHVSLSRTPRAGGPLKTPQAEYEKSYDTILTGLAPCLPPEAFNMPDRR